MKGYIQIVTVLLAVFAVTLLMVALIATGVNFDAVIASSQQEDLDLYQSKLYMHTTVQDRDLINNIASYTATGSQETENRVRNELRDILGGSGSSYSYRAAVKEAGSLNSGENTLQVTNDNEALYYTRILVPSPKTIQYELELGSKVQ